MTTAPSPAELAFDRVVTPGASLYALVDAAQDAAGPWEAQQAGLECRSLFEGRMGTLLKDLAPYLIEFPLHSTFKSWWFEQWGNSVGVLLESPLDLPELRRHFRTLTIVRDAERTKYFFRFYDPRVLRVFLPTCTADELRQFFGPIDAFYCEEQGGSELLVFTHADGKLSLKRRPITQGG
ncbi:MAG TPA: DUF4123 domain-containing protein [Phycisphaerae bacterium]|jgi:hypothetical protein